LRICLKNTREFWLVRADGYTDKVDGDGYKTGERIPNYTIPTQVTLSFYQLSGNSTIGENGRVEEYEFICYSTDDILKEADLLFETEPTSDFDTTYDYRVEKRIVNLNSNKYGLVKRT
jgi:hypothetical protein